MKKRTTLIIAIIAILLLCCCAITAGAGALIYVNRDKDDKDTTTSKTTKKTTEETTMIVQDTPPTAGEAKDAYMAATNYKFDGELVFDDGYVTKLDGAFISPDKEICNVDEPMAMSQEITIGGTYYVSAQGGSWDTTNDPNYAMHQRNEMLSFFDGVSSTTVAKDSGSYWDLSYHDDHYDEDWSLLISKDTGLPYKLVIEYTSTDGYGVVATISFSDYNNPSLSITAPI